MRYLLLPFTRRYVTFAGALVAAIVLLPLSVNDAPYWLPFGLAATLALWDSQPFSRSERTLAYERAKVAVDKFPFGTELDVNATSFEWLNHSVMPKPVAVEPFRISVGGPSCLRKILNNEAPF